MRALCAVDLEDPEDRGLAAARDLLARLAATVDLLYVDPFDDYVWLPEETEKLDWIEAGGLERRDAELTSRLEGVLATFPPERRGTVSLARARRPADEIVARAPAYDLLVVGTSAREGPARLWLGSVAEKVVRASPVPVLVARGTMRAESAVRALLAVDVFADTAAEVVLAAAPWVTRLSARADVGFALGALAGLDGGVPPDAVGWETALAALEGVAGERLAALADRLPEGARGVERLGRGDAAACVADWSAGYALVVTASHQRKGLGRVWLGSVSERVVRSSWCSVLVLPLGDGA
jgi:nucleotide-binding universal stress UspA family protein